MQCFVLPVPDAEQREYNAGDKGADADHDIGISAAVQQHRAVPGQNDGKTRNMLLIQQGRNADCQKQTNCGESAVENGMKMTVITVDGNGMLSIPSNLQDLWMSEGVVS